MSDAGGFDDKSFNQLSYEGVQQAADELGTEVTEVESNSENDFAPNLESLVAEGCDAIVTVGFALASATKESAAANPDIDYILVDDAADGGDDGATFDGKPDEENIKPLLYNTAEAAFLAGYLAADYSETGVVGTYGGQPFPTVTIFMDGFKQGVDYYNEQKGAKVKVVGWNGKDGAFTGGFEANNVATQTANRLLDQNADVILPVGGPIYQGALTAIADAGRDVALIGVDADFYETDPNTQDVVLTSILKNMDVSTYEAVMAVRRGRARLHAVRRHARERRRGYRAVPQLRGQGVGHGRRRARRDQGRHHRRLDRGHVVPPVIDHEKTSSEATVGGPQGPPTVASGPALGSQDETRPAPHHQALRLPRRQRRHLAHRRTRRDPLPPRRERRRASRR